MRLLLLVAVPISVIYISIAALTLESMDGPTFLWYFFLGFWVFFELQGGHVDAGRVALVDDPTLVDHEQAQGEDVDRLGTGALLLARLPGPREVEALRQRLARDPLHREGGEAIGILALDSKPPAEALTEILSQEEITRASIVTLPPAGEVPAWMGG